MKKEIWKDIVGYEGMYQISNIGRIKSLKRKGVTSDRILNTGLCHGYLTVTLTKDKRLNQKLISRLLFEHFKGNLIDGMVIDHRDNVKLNNNLDNLQQITIRENASKDRFRANTSSEYLGVSWCNIKSKWRATIYDGNKRKHIGYYEDEKQASIEYQKEKEIILKELQEEIKKFEI